MKKKFPRWTRLVISLALCTAISGYFGLQYIFSKLPNYVVAKLNERKIDVHFSTLDRSTLGLTYQVPVLRFGGAGLSSEIELHDVEVSLRFTGWPLLTLSLSAKQGLAYPHIRPENPSGIRKSPGIDRLPLWLTAFTSLRFSVLTFDLLPSSLTLKPLQMAYFPSGSLWHEVALDKWNAVNIYPKATWTGHSKINAGSLLGKNQKINVGEYELRIEPQINLSSRAWSAHITSPATDEVLGSWSGGLDEFTSTSGSLILKLKDKKISLRPEADKFSFKGDAFLSSDLKMTVEKGALKELVGDIFLDLSKAHLHWKRYLEKPVDVALTVNLQISSTSRRVFEGKAVFANAEFSLSGGLDELQLRSNRFEVGQLTSFFPLISHKESITNLQGPLVVDARWYRKRPWLLTASLDGVSFDYVRPAFKPILVKWARGTLTFSERVIESPGLRLRFPQTDLNLSFTLKKTPIQLLAFSLSSERFTSSDLFEPQSERNVLASSKQKQSDETPTRPVVAPSGSGPDHKQSVPGFEALGSFDLRNLDVTGTKVRRAQGTLRYRNGSLVFDPMILSAFGGRIKAFSTTLQNTGRRLTEARITMNSLDAAEFLSTLSDKAAGIFTGTLDGSFSLRFQGSTKKEFYSSANADGNFLLKNAEILPLKLTRVALEAFSKLPGLSLKIPPTNAHEKLKELTGKFLISGKKVTLSDVSADAQTFHAYSKYAEFDITQQKISSDIFWVPHPSVIPDFARKFFQDSAGKIEVPLQINGPVKSPSVTVKEPFFSSALQRFSQSGAREQLRNEVEKVLRDKLKLHY